MDLRGDSNLASFGVAGCEAPGCPGTSRSLPRLRRGPRVSPLPASSGFTGDQSPRRVEDRMLRRCRLTVSGLPRTAVLRYRRRPGSGLPRNLHLPAPGDDSSRVSPVRFTLRLRQRESSGHPDSSLVSGFSDGPLRQIALAHRSFGGADGPNFGSPRNSVLRLGRLCSSSLPDSHQRLGR